jgi:hypothetical protein
MSKFYGTTIVKDLKVNPSAPSAAADDDGNNNNNNNNNKNNNNNNINDDVKKLNLQPPEFQKFQRGEVERDNSYNNNNNNNNDDEGEEQQQEEKICRICLEEEEEDDNDTMIAPCRCKGGSKWVHRECLDEWRTNERDRAFSKCTECLFEYYIQPVVVYNNNNEDDEAHRHRRRQCYFYWKVSRDLCFGIVIQQLIIILLGIIIWTCDVNKQLPVLLLPLYNHPWILYYLFGWFVFLIILGIYGLIIMCLNGCNLKRAIPKVGPPSEADDAATPLAATATATTSTSTSRTYQPVSQQQQPQYYDYDNYYSHQHTYNNRSAAPLSASTEYYRRARNRRRRRRHYYYDNTYFPMYYPMYVYPTGNHGCCCCCCCCDSNGPPVDVNNIGRHVNNNHGCCDCDCDIGGCFKGCMNNSNSSSSSSSNDNDAKHIILIILLTIAIILAIIGFFVGAIIVVIAFQRIVGRHIYLLQKRQLVQEFQVLDLQEYDLDKPNVAATTATVTATAPPAQYNNVDPYTTYNNMRHPAPSAPYMPPGDAAYLKSLGLMDGA